MAYEPRGYTRKDASRARQRVQAGDKASTGTLDGTTTVEVVSLGIVAQKFTIQSTGDLAGNFEVSANGVNFSTGAAFAANTLVSYNTHNVVAIRITRTGGSGKAIIAAV